MSDTNTDALLDEARDFSADEAEPQQDAAPPVAEAAPEPPRQSEKSVPLAVLLEERAAARAAREELQRVREQSEQSNRRLEELMAAFRERMPQRPAEPIPDMQTDPVGYFQRRDAELSREVAELRAFKQQFEQQGQQLTQEEQFYRTIHERAAEYRAQAPDLDDAVKFLADSLRRDYMEGGLSPAEAQEQLRQQEKLIAGKALREGRNPAEALYRLAKSRGFAPKAPPAEAKMDAMQRGQAAARSTAAPGARGRYDGLTIEGVSRMSAAEIAKLPDDVFRRLMGG